MRGKHLTEHLGIYIYIYIYISNDSEHYSSNCIHCFGSHYTTYLQNQLLIALFIISHPRLRSHRDSDFNYLDCVTLLTVNILRHDISYTNTVTLCKQCVSYFISYQKKQISDVGNANMYAPYALNVLETDEEVVYCIAIRRKHLPHIAEYHLLMRGIREWHDLHKRCDTVQTIYKLLYIISKETNVWCRKCQYVTACMAATTEVKDKDSRTCYHIWFLLKPQSIIHSQWLTL